MADTETTSMTKTPNKRPLDSTTSYMNDDCSICLTDLSEAKEVGILQCQVVVKTQKYYTHTFN